MLGNVVLCILSGFFCGITATVFIQSLIKETNSFKKEMKNVKTDIRVLSARMEHMYNHLSIKYR